MRPSSRPLASSWPLALVLIAACGFPDRDFLPDDEFANSTGGASGQAGQAGQAGKGGAGQGGKSAAGAAGAGQGGAPAGGAGQGGTGQAGAGQAGAGQGGEAGEGGTSGGAGAGQGGSGGLAGQGGAGQGGLAGSGGSGQGGASGAGQGGAGAGGAGTGGTTGTCHDACTPGAKMASSCSPCAAKVCSQGPYANCCTQDWGAACVQAAKMLCAPDCQNVGGSGGASGSSGQGGAGGAGASGAGAGGAGKGGAGQGGAGQGGAGQAGAGAAGAGQGGAGQGGAGQGGAGAGGGGQAGGGVVNGPCDGNGDCVATQLCNTPVYATDSSKCGDPSAIGTLAIGQPCTKNGECLSRYCGEYNRVCTVFCDNPGQCGPGNVCAETLYILQSQNPDSNAPTWLPNTCLVPCQRNSDCPANSSGSSICFLTNNVIEDTVLPACQFVGLTPAQNPAIKTFGNAFDPMKDFCDTGYSVTVTKPDNTKLNICSRACVDASDCADPYPVCGNLNATNPSGVGTSQLKTCVPAN